MTVENTQNKMPPLQMGVATEYPFTFAVLLQDPTEEEALQAIKASVLQADGTEIELVYNTDYTVVLNPDRIGGTLTVNDIRTSSDYITIYRQYAQTQEVDYKDFNSAPAETFEQCFDKLTMLSQQQQEEINRSIKLPVSSDITKLSLPNPVAGRTLKWNESETGLINSDVSIDEIDEFVKSANESAEIAVEKAEEITGKLDEALEVSKKIKDIEIIATLEIGDIGFTQMAIDESKGKRRVLNGQLIIQEQYVQFTNIIKNSVALNPDLACTEAEWQTTVTMSAFGICNKFVIDDEAGTIRLPKYPNYFIGGVDDIAPVVGNGNVLGLTDGNITGFGVGVDNYISGKSSSLPVSVGTVNTSTSVFAGRRGVGVVTDPTKSGIEAQIKQEQIKGTYFIQVATGAETEDNIINEIELNNPYSFGDSKYSPVALNNLSWLKSEGQYNPKAVYPAYYDWLLKIYNGVEVVEGVSVKLSTETFDDYDWVLNTADETFRLPLLDGSEDLIGDDYVSYTISGTQNEYTANYNGIVSTILTCGVGAVNLYNSTNTHLNTSSYQIYNVTNNIVYKLSIQVNKGDKFILQYPEPTNPIYKTLLLRKATGNGSLYFYVGETVQNANLINAGRIEEKIASLIPDNSSLISGYGFPSSKSVDLTLGASGTTYTAPANGWFILRRRTTAVDQYVTFSVSNANFTNVCYGLSQQYSTTPFTSLNAVPVQKGYKLHIAYNIGGGDSGDYFRFIYAEGEQ